MAQTSKEAFRAVLDEMLASTGGFVPMAEFLPALSEFVGEHCSEGFVCTMHPLPPTGPAEYPGPGGIIEAWSDFGEGFEAMDMRLESVEESSAATLILAESRVRTRTGGVELSQPVAAVCIFVRGLVSSVQFHLDRSAAREAANLGPTS